MNKKKYINKFSFSRIPKISFGKGELNNLCEKISGFGKTALIVTGSSSFRSSGKLDIILNLLKKKSLNFFIISDKGEPSPDFVDENVTAFKDKKIEVVVSIGGGSVIDAGKAISAMLTQECSVLDFL